ncbi:NAD(P)-dependent oxidoreductase [Kineococcus sp. SYSU DK001]|uniref:NAD(P)-dependent oxidoreductase n=1 Tax=Kineococcus sp. SYSU DK001 TaxID=3383122 RepID=UPI003D7C856A
MTARTMQEDVAAGTGARLPSVTVLGCGLMGSAVARALARAGAPVTAWNRDPAKARALAGDGVTAVQDARDAIAAGTVVVAVLGTYDHVEEVLGEADLTGRVVVNLTTGTPVRAAAAAERVQGRGGGYLDGAVLNLPGHVGTPENHVVVSGTPQAWEGVAGLLRHLGGTVEHVGEPAGAANSLDAAIVGGLSAPALVAAAHATRFALDAGVGPEQLLRLMDRTARRMPGYFARIVDDLREQRFATQEAALGTWAEGLSSFLGAFHAAGAPAPMVEAALADLERAAGAGHGDRALWAVAARETDVQTIV